MCKTPYILRALIVLELEKKNNNIQNLGTEQMMMMAMATKTRTKMMTTMRAYMKCEDDKQQVG